MVDGKKKKTDNWKGIFLFPLFPSTVYLLPFTVFIFLIPSSLYSQDMRAEPRPNPLLSAPEIKYDPSFPKRWLGETLEYEIKWGMVSVGKAQMTVPKLVEISSSPCYYIVSSAKSSSFVDTFYKVRDLNESWLDASLLISMGYSKKIREGGFLRDEWTVFDNKNLSFKGQKINKNNIAAEQSGQLSGPVQDILSSLYFTRTQKLETGKDIILDVNTQKNWPLVIKVYKKERVKTPAGEFECYVVEPKIREEGIFVAKGKKLMIWLTADEERIPVLMKAEVFIGHVSARLVRHFHE